MKRVTVVVFVFLLTSVLGGCGSKVGGSIMSESRTSTSTSRFSGSSSSSSSALTTEKVQRAVEKQLAWTRTGGTVVVTGIQELPQENAAQADIRFESFQYNADDMGNPVSKDRQAPKKPDVNSPNFYDEMYKYGTQQVRTRNYSGRGVATLKHYNDGRWVLTAINFGMFGVSGNTEVQ